METVHFIIYRKAAFAGALLPYNIYINGQLVGTIKNGKTLNVDVPKADVYYLEDNNDFERNAVICDSDRSEYSVLLKRAGGWRTSSYNEFYLENDQQTVPLPSFHLEKYKNAIDRDSTAALSSDERILAFCLAFWSGIVDDIQELLSSDDLTEIIDALQKVGATRYANLLLQIINELFSDVVLPLSDKQLNKMHDRINIANKLIWHDKKSAGEELHSAVIKYITSRLNSKENVY